MPSVRVLLLVGLLLFGGTIAPAAQVEAPPAPAGDGSAADQDFAPAANGTATPAPLPTAAAGEVRSAELPTAAPQIIQLPAENGELIPVPLDVTLKEFLDWRKQRQAAPVAAPDYSLSSITLEGQAEEDRAMLRATIKLQLHRDDQWIRVPIGLNEAVLEETGYAGAGEASFAGTDRDAGYRWWFRGKGEHELKLSLIVPLRKQTPGRRLQLTIPATAASLLKLTVPQPRLTTKVVPENAWMKVTGGDEGPSRIEVRGLGTRLDLTWQSLPNVQKIETVLQAETLIQADFTGESVVLEANQTIDALQGSFSEVHVLLPEGFALLDVEERQGKLYSDHQIDPGNPRRVTIQLVEPTVGPFKLRWVLETDFPAKGGTLTLSGFEVERARRQTGEIAVSAVEGYRVSKRDGEDRLVHRINASRVPGAGRLVTAYRFLVQPFRLVLDAREIEPHFLAESQFDLRFSSTHAELSGNIHYEVSSDRGAIQEIELRWPNWKDEGWVIEPLDAASIVEQATIPADGSGVIKVRLVTRRTGSFDLPIRARRPVTPGAEPLPLTLPFAVSTSRPLTRIAVSSDDNLEVTLTPADGTVLGRGVPDEEPGKPFGRSAPETELRIESEQLTFAAQLTPHSQAITTELAVTTELLEDRMVVVQQIGYQVAWERLAQVRLMIPNELERHVQFSLADGTLLVPQWTGLEVGGLRQVRIPLPVPVLGRTEVLARFVLELSESVRTSREAELRIPIIQSSDTTEYQQIRAAFRNRDDLEVSIVGDEWRRQPTLDATLEWSSRDAHATIIARLDRSEQASAAAYTVTKALIRATFDENGLARCRGSYRLSRGVPQVVLLFPPQLVPESFWWNRTRLNDGRVTEIPPGSGEYRVELPEEAVGAESGLLTVDFHSTEPSPLGWSQSHRLMGPRLSPNVWVGQSVWQIVFPFNQHLFTSPRGFVPQYRWERSRILWSRVPAPGFERPLEWIGSDDGPAVPTELTTGNTYTFSRFGPTSAISFGTMSRSIIVLVGAGLALAVGFVLLKVPATRNVLTLLAAVFLLTLTALAFTEPVQLLLQPAIFGTALAVVATLIEGRLRRERQAAILTLSSPSDFITPTSSASSVEQFLPAGVGSEEPTAVRPLSSPRHPEAVSSQYGAGR